MSKLLILGNGFDLHCGLESSYHHFFQYLLKDPVYGVSYNFLYDKLSIKSKTRTNLVWALLLAYHDDRNQLWWKDIESILSSFLHVATDNYIINLNQVLGDIQKYTTELREYEKHRIYEGSSIIKFLWIVYRGGGLGDICSFKTKIDSTIAIPNDVNIVLERFYDDLISIERKFAEYLSSIYNVDPQLHVNANFLLSKLLDLDISKYDSKDKLEYDLSNTLNKDSILSFNYTRAGQPNGGDFPHYRNIHGCFLGRNSEIIFGIESDNISPLNPVYKFTKTYRVSLLESKLISIPDIFTGQISLSNVDKIIIYGHSLNKQDASYFYAIFNRCDIDKSNVTICLYYSDYGNVDRSTENLLRLQNLIFEYQTLFGVPRGLFQRMLLEGRIRVVKI